MSRFLQLHMLTSYPPANLNRDDLGRPKTAKMGGTDRLRISSQCLKRTWRSSELFQQSLQGALGERTKLLGVELFKYLIRKDVAFTTAEETSAKIAGVFGKNEKSVDLEKKKEKDIKALHKKLTKKWRGWDRDNLGIAEYPLEKLHSLQKVEIAQLAFISPEERNAAFALADTVAAGGAIGDKIDLLRETTTGVDIAMFGRMLADNAHKNIEAACQVAHAISVHPTFRLTVQQKEITVGSGRPSKIDSPPPGIRSRRECQIGCSVVPYLIPDG